MYYKTFTINALAQNNAEDDLNKFLSSHRIITIQKEFVPEDKSWYFLVEYTDEGAALKTSSGKIDYMKVLSQEDFAIFSKLRELRKKIALEEKIPAYAVFTDEQLSRIAKEKPESISKMQNINGIGESKTNKYGKAFLSLINPGPPQQPANSDGHEFDIF